MLIPIITAAIVRDLDLVEYFLDYGANPKQIIVWCLEHRKTKLQALFFSLLLELGLYLGPDGEYASM